MLARVKLAFLALIFLLPSATGRAVTAPETQALTQVQEEAKRGNYQLISPDVIRARFLQDPSSLFFVDTREEWEYQWEHIQQAVNLPVSPTWWTQYSPWARTAMERALGPDKKRSKAC